MTARSLRYTTLQLAVLGFEAVWVSLFTAVLARTAGGEVGWLPLFLVGGTLLLWNRLLLWRELWQRWAGRLAALGGAGLLLVALLRAVAPHELARLGGATGFANGVRLFFDSPPLVIGALAGSLVLFLVLFLLRAPLTVWAATRHLRLSTLLVALMLVLARGPGEPLSLAALPIFFACALLAHALARAHDLSRLPQGNYLPYNRRWLMTLGGSVGAALGVGLIASLPVAPNNLALLHPAGRLLRGGLMGAMNLVLQAVFAVVVPLTQKLVEVYRKIFLSVLLPLLRQLSELDRASPNLAPLDPTALRVLGVVLLVLAVAVPLLALRTFYRLHRLLSQLDAEAAPEIGAAEAAGWRDGLERGGAALQGLLRRLWRPEYGVDTVRDLYRNLLRFGDEHGLARPSEDTPYEYLEPLCAHYPQRAEDFLALTDAYVAARYGERTFSRADVAHLRTAWQRIATVER